MSRDYKLFLKGFCFLCVLACIYGAIVMWRTARENQVRRELDQYTRQQMEKDQGFNFAGQHVAPPNPATTLPSANNTPSSGVSKRLLNDIAFSPDGKFVAATVNDARTPEFVVWRATGGNALYYDGAQNQQVASSVWFDKNHILDNGLIWHLHHSGGQWKLQEKKRVFAQPSYDETVAQEVLDFPSSDLRLRQVITHPQNNFANVNVALEAYALSSGVRLPLPKDLKLADVAREIKPLGRWGKAPLRLALWSEEKIATRRKGGPWSNLEVWDARVKKRLWQKKFTAREGRLLVGGNGRWVAVAGTPRSASTPFIFDHQIGIEVFDALNGKRLASTTMPEIKHRSAVLSPDGKLMALHAADPNPNAKKRARHVVVYELPTLRLLKKLPFSYRGDSAGANTPVYGPLSMAFSHDNHWLALENVEQIQLLDWRGASSAKVPKRILKF